MVFSSFTFLFVFLPVTLLCYYLFKNRTIKNIILLLFSLLFYAWGEPIYILLMMLSIIINYYLAIKIDKAPKHKKKLLIIDILINIGIITFFKYGNFIIQNINTLTNLNIPKIDIPLPIGISFYTFQVLSYVIDVYKKNAPLQKNIINLGMYITLFPQLIAGPIVRYTTISEQILNRKETLTDFISGTKRFIIGLGKKIIIANQLALIADTIYHGNLISTGTLMLWIAAISYTLQIYFDFSGYSDMAIGLGKMFGFKFLENFNYPYIAKNITDFWRKWHISLSTWFRDYVYIPLGGNRVSKLKWLRNILIVWILTGLWHGASWNFVIWGLYYGIILIIEKIFLNKLTTKFPNILQHLYALIFVIIGWTIFRLENMTKVFISLQGMFIYRPSNLINDFILDNNIFTNLPYILLGLLGATPIIPKTANIIKNKEILYKFITNTSIIIIFIICIIFLEKSTYNPFIYFRF